jgi:hypothetical protein
MFAEIEFVFGGLNDVSFYKERQQTLEALTNQNAESIAERGVELAGYEVLRVGENKVYAFRIASESNCDISIVSSVVSGYCFRSHQEMVMHLNPNSDKQKPYKELPQGHYLFELQSIPNN